MMEMITLCDDGNENAATSLESLCFERRRIPDYVYVTNTMTYQY